MPTVDVDDKVDLERLLDDDVPCANPKCDAPAEWAVKNACCNLQVCVCQKCLREIKSALVAALNGRVSLNCKWCAASMTPADVSWWPL